MPHRAARPDCPDQPDLATEALEALRDMDNGRAAALVTSIERTTGHL
jgi:hypothetical protein